MDLREYQNELFLKRSVDLTTMATVQRLARQLRHITLTAKFFGYSLEELASLDMEDSETSSHRR